MNAVDIPPFVTFETGAKLLVDMGIDPNATGDSVRYVARHHPDWPFGEERSHKYVMIGNARTMETGVFLAWHRQHPRSGRGRDRAPRKPRGETR